MRELILGVKINVENSGYYKEEFKKNDAVEHFKNFKRSIGFGDLSPKEFLNKCSVIELYFYNYDSEIINIVTRGRIDIMNNIDAILEMIEYQKTFYPIDFDILETLLDEGYSWDKCLSILQENDFGLIDEDEIDTYCMDYLYARFPIEEELERFIALDEVWYYLKEKKIVVRLLNNKGKYISVFVDR